MHRNQRYQLDMYANDLSQADLLSILLIISLFEFFVYFQLPDRNGVHQSSFDLILGILTRADEEDSAVSFSIRILGHGRNFHCRLIFVAFQQTLLNQHPCINVLTTMLMMMIGNFPKLHDHFE